MAIPAISEYDKDFIQISMSVRPDLPITHVEVINEPINYRFRRSRNESASTTEVGSRIHTNCAIVGILAGRQRHHQPRCNEGISRG
jgi:hypothetical protein